MDTTTKSMEEANKAELEMLKEKAQKFLNTVTLDRKTNLTKDKMKTKKEDLVKEIEELYDGGTALFEHFANREAQFASKIRTLIDEKATLELKLKANADLLDTFSDFKLDGLNETQILKIMTKRAKLLKYYLGK